MIENLRLDEPMEMTFEITDADMKILQETLCDINIKECPWFEIQDKYGNKAKYYRESQWIPIKWHDCTDEDREKYGFSNDIVAVFDCEMPDDDQPILVTTSHGYVNQDVCYIDDGYSLDSGWDWIEDIKAWMPLPEPYAERREE